MKKIILPFLLFCFVGSAHAQAPLNLGFESSDRNLTSNFHLVSQTLHRFRINDGLGNENGFSIKTLRPGVTGEVRQLDLRYSFAGEFAADQNNADARLLDAFVVWSIQPQFRLRFGQFRIPWNKEFNQPVTEIQFVDRSLGSAVFGLARDVGVDFQSDWLDGRLRNHTFLINGDGMNQISNDSSMLVGNAVEFDLMGSAGTKISDLAVSADPQILLGAALAFDFGNDELNGNKLFRALLHSQFRYLGIGALAEAHFVRNTEISKNDFGAIFQIGYLFYEDIVEAAIRYAGHFVDGASALGNFQRSQHELTAGLNGFYWGQYLKVQLNYSLFLNAFGDKDRNDHQISTQAQFYF